MNLAKEKIDTHEDTIDILELLKILWNYKYLIIACTFVSGAVAVVLALRAIPVFEAESAITEVTDGSMRNAASLASQFGGLASMVGVNLAGAGGAGREAQALLKSRRIAEKFVLQHNLIPIMYPKATKPPTLWKAVKHFRDDLVAVREDKRLGLTVVAVKWTDPVIAANWANDYVRLVNEERRADAIRQSKSSIEYLNAQIEQASGVELRRVLFNLVEQETKTLTLANARPDYAFTIVDPAVAPEERISPHRTMMVLLGLALGGVVGTMLAFAHSVWRRRKPDRKAI